MGARKKTATAMVEVVVPATPEPAPAEERTTSLFPGEAPPAPVVDDEPEEKPADEPPPGQKRLKFRGDASTVRLSSTELLRALGAVQYAAASPNEERPHLATVHFHASDELVLSATSGFWFARWTMEPEELPAMPVAMLVDIIDVRRLLPLLSVDAKNANVVELDFAEGAARLSDGTVLPLGKRDIGETPDYDAVIPKTPPLETSEIAWNPNLMSRAMRAFKAGYGNDVGVRVEFRGPLAGIVMRPPSGHDQLYVIVMPLRTAETEPAPTASGATSGEDGAG